MLRGVLCAIYDKKLSSEVGFKGIAKKVMILFLVGIGTVLDTHIIKAGNVVRTTVIFYYVSNEGISILENATRLGIPFPDKLKEVLEQLRADDSEESTKQ